MTSSKQRDGPQPKQMQRDGSGDDDERGGADGSSAAEGCGFTGSRELVTAVQNACRHGQLAQVVQVRADVLGARSRVRCSAPAPCCAGLPWMHCGWAGRP